MKVQALIPDLSADRRGIKNDRWETVFESEDVHEVRYQAEMARRFYVTVRVVE